MAIMLENTSLYKCHCGDEIAHSSKAVSQQELLLMTYLVSKSVKTVCVSSIQTRSLRH